MEAMVGLAIVLGSMFLLFQFRGTIKKEARAMEAEATASYAKRYAKAVVRANKTYEHLRGKELLTLEEIEARLEGEIS